MASEVRKLGKCKATAMGVVGHKNFGGFKILGVCIEFGCVLDFYNCKAFISRGSNS